MVQGAALADITRAVADGAWVELDPLPDPPVLRVLAETPEAQGA